MNTELLKREPIEGTPFYIIGNDEKGYFLSLGKYRLTEPTDTMVETYNLLESQQWDITLKMLLTLIELKDEYTKQHDIS